MGPPGNWTRPDSWPGGGKYIEIYSERYIIFHVHITCAGVYSIYSHVSTKIEYIICLYVIYIYIISCMDYIYPVFERDSYTKHIRLKFYDLKERMDVAFDRSRAAKGD